MELKDLRIIIWLRKSGSTLERENGETGEGGGGKRKWRNRACNVILLNPVGQKWWWGGGLFRA